MYNIHTDMTDTETVDNGEEEQVEIEGDIIDRMANQFMKIK